MTRLNCALLVMVLMFGQGCSDDDVSPDAGVADSAPVEAGRDQAADSSADQSAAGPNKVEVAKLVKPIMDGKWTTGLVVGLISDKGKEVYAFGKTSASGAAPDQDSVFEVGSITKTFTSLALASMVADGTVKLTTPVKSLLPAAKVTMPSHSSGEITLRHLSTHTSGLPRLPSNIKPKDMDNPYVDYTDSDLYSFLSSYTLPRAPDAKWEYSNLAVGLLGHALSLKANKGYEALVAERLTTPLKMTDTVIKLSAAQAKRMAQGHDHDGVAVKAWENGVLGPCFAYRSTIRDLLVYAANNAGITSTKLDATLAESHKVHYSGTQTMGLGWFIFDSRYLFHNGGTGGFETFVGFDRKARVGVVALSNNSPGGWTPTTKLGLELLKMMAKQTYKAVDIPATVSVPSATLELYAGSYTGSQTIIVQRKGDALYLSMGTNPKQYRMYATSSTTFYLRYLKIGVTFVKDRTGKVSSMEFSTTSGKATLTRQ